MEYIDLGLPSGTQWAEENIDGLYNYEETVEKYGGHLPTKNQLEELKDLCKWEFMCNGYKVTGPNGNTIVLPADGIRNFDGDAYCVGYDGHYWSSTPRGSDFTWYLCFNFSGVYIYDSIRSIGKSVRLVK